MRWAWVAAVWMLGAAGLARAHEVPADARVVAFVKPEGRELQLLLRVPLAAMRDGDARSWIAEALALREDGRPLAPGAIVATRVSEAADPSFARWESALAHVRGPRLGPSAAPPGTAAFLDVLVAYPIASERAGFAIHPRFVRFAPRVSTTLRFLPPGGTERAFELHGDPGWVDLDPGWTQAAWRFLVMGMAHILDGTDHLLFIACLVIPFRRLRALVAIVTAFTLAHSITLALAATGHAPDAPWFPPLVELAIAASIVALALENAFGANAGRRWIVAFAFGLVHGFGFAFALAESLQFAGGHLAVALAAFNGGVEIGQVAVLLVLVPVLDFAFRFVPERLGTVILSVPIALVGGAWLLERWAALAAGPGLAPDAANLMRWAMGAMVPILGAWAIRRRLKARRAGGGAR